MLFLNGNTYRPSTSLRAGGLEKWSLLEDKRIIQTADNDARIVAYTSMRTNIVIEEKLIEKLLQPVR